MGSRRPPNAATHLDVVGMTLSCHAQHGRLRPANGHSHWGTMDTDDRRAVAGAQQVHDSRADRPVGAEFLRMLCSQPDGDAVAYAIVHGPCSRYGASASAIFTVDAERTSLSLIGDHGFSPASLSRYRMVPVSVDVPVTQAFRTGENLSVRGSHAVERFPRTEEFFDIEESSLERDWLHLPLTYRGVAIGVLVIAFPTDLTWHWADHGHLESLAAVITLWAYIQSAPRSPLSAYTRRTKAGTLALTDRQLQVLTGIRNGQPNKAIARELGYSISTIKAEVQEILARLGAADRHDAIIKAQRAGISMVEIQP